MQIIFDLNERIFKICMRNQTRFGDQTFFLRYKAPAWKNDEAFKNKSQFVVGE